MTKPMTGQYRGTRRGYGFIVPDHKSEDGADWFVAAGDSGGAWDGDKVAFVPTDSLTSQGRQAAKVTSILHRANKTVTGRLCKEGRLVWLAPDNSRLPSSIALKGKLKGASVGDKAAVAVLSYGTAKTVPIGALREVFGRAGSRETSTEAILYQHDISPHFPPPVLEAAHSVPQQVSQEAIQGRLDLRDRLIVTIDGLSAKDLDDAVSLDTDEEGRPVLGVHIADVSHYVPAGGILDREAFERGTSVYYADRVAPMLPPALSNGICSLHPQVDRLTLSCFMTLDEDHKVVRYTIQKSVIRSAGRLNYDQCNRFLAGEETDLPARFHDLIRRLDSLARARVKVRRNRGALLLETGECAFLCDEEGRPVAVTRQESGPAQSLIEECMLLANETVAEHLVTLGLPGVYRIHEDPTGDKGEALKAMLAPLGLSLRQMDGHHLQTLIDQVRGTGHAAAVNMMVLRSMMKARYDEKNLGHFGLAAGHYCHFTSPIRRYPDLVVHRVLTAWLAGDQGALSKLAAFTPRAAAQSTDREVAAVTAEREIEKLYMAEYMAGHIGEEYAALVSGASRAGLFVTMENGIEGMVPLDGGFAEEDYPLGTPLRVVCVAADPGSGEITLAFPGRDAPAPPPRQTKSAAARPPRKTRRSSPPPRRGRRGRR